MGRQRVLVLHGNRQTGDLLLGRLSSLRRKASRRLDVELVAPDAPFLWDSDAAAGDDDAAAPLRTWWRRRGDAYDGLEQSLAAVRAAWEDCGDCVGLLGFSQGARLAHLLALLHAAGAAPLRGLCFVVLAAGYGDVPLPKNLVSAGGDVDLAVLERTCIRVASLHVMGLSDGLVTAASSRALLAAYEDPATFEHEGGHHVPMQAAAVEAYLSFMEAALRQAEGPCDGGTNGGTVPCVTRALAPPTQPGIEQAQAQRDECESLALIFPDEFTLHSQSVPDEDSEYGRQLLHPISYSIRLRPPSDQVADASLWPPDANLALRVTYPPAYPDAPPTFALDHAMSLLEFKIGQERACLGAVRDAAAAEAGMPCVMGCIYAAREFFEGGGLAAPRDAQSAVDGSNGDDGGGQARETTTHSSLAEDDLSQRLLLPASRERIAECHQQGLDIACSVLGHRHVNGEASSDGEDPDSAPEARSQRGGKGGTWRYTIGLVGKPSAGKSTFFNAASAFARQRGAEAGADAAADAELGGATMAPHPFTTIDPNVGYCLVPAPPGSCPEDDDGGAAGGRAVGSTHGRDSRGRRLLPVTLKDVAGLVPGAYAGRGKGNKFLDDLTDADVLLHVVDASGSSDAEGNKVGFESTDGAGIGGAGSHPLEDLSWIRHELLEWVYSNLATKWDSVVRRGRTKLLAMFSGYGATQEFTWDVLTAVEKYLESREGRLGALDDLADWDEGDLRRLVSAFLGVRFPMALALNKSDLPSAARYVRDIEGALPVHGAHCAVPLCAKSEMTFVRESITSAVPPSRSAHASNASVPEGVWSCLQLAMGLREPVLVFPVNDMVTYGPLPGLTEHAIGHASLPNGGMIACLGAAGGSPPSHWDAARQQYTATCDGMPRKEGVVLRDVLVMKPGSKVEDAFWALKALGALGGDFVRAEGARHMGEKAKLVKKDDFLCRDNRILRVMSNKRTQWQKKG